MKLPLITIRSILLPLVAISGLFSLPVSAKEISESQELIRLLDRGDIDQVERILKQKDIDVNAKNSEGDTALMLASGEGHI